MPNPPGRRPRRGSPMPATTITASAEEMTFLMLLGDGPLSRGVQTAVNRLAKVDPEAAALMRQSIWIRQRVETLLKAQNKEVGQSDIYKYVTENFLDLVNDFQSADIE
ncbi:MAG: hypothetical protein M9896_13985 [Candidatus Promineofilum sp.]|uniref:hypothetical protein n=1 Tax=Promineifilum sp. TaxID=2664178 RepID=UPI002411E33A|nr:hypothetical protein [Promineifilum sp.]